MKRSRIAPLLLPLGLIAVPAHSQEAAATLGKQRAATSRIEWEVRDAGHPNLGNIRVATMKNAVETPVGANKVYSRAYFSCQKGLNKFAVELANATAPDDPKGLKPGTMPRLVCSRPITPWDEKMVQEDLLANWQVADIGDALTRGLRAFPLRECASIRVEQEVVLPAGWAKKTAKVEFDLMPYSKELDAVFAACGERSAYAPDAAAPILASAPSASPPVAPNRVAAPIKAAVAPPLKLPAPVTPSSLEVPAPASASASAPAPALAWKIARIATSGKTNVRAGPSTQSAIVVQLDPGSVVTVQKTANEWWRAKTSGGKFEGYIREDRLVFK